MKTQLFNEDDTLGKTISYIDSLDDKIFIGFTDDTFIIFYSYESSETIYVSDDVYTDRPDKWNYENLFIRGFITEQQFNSFKEEDLRNIEAQKGANTQREINLLKTLKIKYPNV